MSLYLVPVRSRPAWLLAVLVLIACDQSSKAWFARTIELGEAIEVTAWFNWVHVRNPGAAFSLLANAGGWQRYLFMAIGACVIVPVTMACLAREVHPLERAGGALLVAGGSGNLIDRIASGEVTDFIDLHWRGAHWPAFNIADVFLVLAVGLWASLWLRTPVARPEDAT